MVRIYTEFRHYKRPFREEMIHLLKPFTKMGSQIVSELCRIYGDWVLTIEMVDNPENANLIVLPMSWNYYVQSNQKQLALDFIETSRARNPNAPIITFISGDFGVAALVKDVTIIRASGYANKRLPHQLAQPVFIEDPLHRFFNRNAIFVRNKELIPSVGYCGYANGRYAAAIYDLVRTGLRNTAYYIRLDKREPQMMISASHLRSKALDLLEHHPKVRTNFIRRSRYRAGARTTELVHATSMEYFENMRQSDYILCSRGGGNFSKRLYETMAMGRVPIFVNTDCILPFDDVIEWKRHSVFVEKRDLASIGEALHEFHNSLSEDDFKSVQFRNRKLWEDHLSSSGFWTTLLEKYKQSK